MKIKKRDYNKKIRIFFILFLVIFLSFNVLALKVNLNFDDDIADGVATDSSGNGFDGICLGTTCPTYLPTGGYDGKGAYQFDGVDDSIDVGTDTFGMDESDEFTISFWMNSGNGPLYTEGIIGKGPHFYPFGIQLSGESLRSIVRTSATNYLYFTEDVNSGEWYHVVVTYSNGVQTNYFNGVEDSSNLIPDVDLLVYSNMETTVGEAAGSYFLGVIDDVRIYDYALSAGEVSELYGGVPLVCTDNDGDGYGLCPNCGIINGCVYDGNDCRDDNININLGAVEICGDFEDNDCDGLTDCVDSDCSGDPVCDLCGNDIIDGTEVCDGTDVRIETCMTQGFDSGTLGCLSDCSGYDTSECITFDECSDCGLLGIGCNLETCHQIGDCYYDPIWIPWESDCFDVSTACLTITQCSDYTDGECNYDACNLNCRWDENECIEEQIIPSEAIIIDHRHIDISQIPPEYVQAIKEDFSIHYAGRSHAYQISGFGMRKLSENTGGINGDYYYVENNDGSPQLNSDRIDIALYLTGENYGTEPFEYFGGTRSNVNWDRSQGPHPIETYLDANPLISVSVFNWCGELAAWLDHTDYVEGYLSAMNNLEQMYAPGGSKGRTEDTQVKFVYMTSHTQKFDDGAGTDREGAYTYLANERIREYCIENNKTLFDFGDLESWGLTDGQGISYDNFDFNGEWELSNPITFPGPLDWQGGMEYDITFYPYHSVWGDVSNPGLYWQGEEISYHTREEHAQLKAQAIWWMMARLAGWPGPGTESVCGDGIIEGLEVCDRENIGVETCLSQGFDSGTLGCLSDCSGYDTSECIFDPVCIDNDGDGYGLCPNCGIINGCVYDGNDCRDDNININLGVVEMCEDFEDNDCDGLTDCADSDCSGDPVCDSPPPVTGLSLWLPFEGDMRDSSGNGFDGICLGTTCPTYLPTGGYDGKGAYQFDGVDDSIDVGTDTFGMDESDEFTISFWMNSGNGPLYTEGIIGKGPHFYPFGIQLSGESLRSIVRTSATNYLYFTEDVNSGEWYHVVVTYSNGVQTNYFNGVEDSSNLIPDVDLLVYSNMETTVGEAAGSYFLGVIDDVRIYDYALSAGEVSELYGG